MVHHAIGTQPEQQGTRQQEYLASDGSACPGPAQGFWLFAVFDNRLYLDQKVAVELLILPVGITGVVAVQIYPVRQLLLTFLHQHQVAQRRENLAWVQIESPAVIEFRAAGCDGHHANACFDQNHRNGRCRQSTDDSQGQQGPGTENRFKQGHQAGQILAGTDVQTVPEAKPALGSQYGYRDGTDDHQRQSLAGGLAQSGHVTAGQRVTEFDPQQSQVNQQ